MTPTPAAPRRVYSLAQLIALPYTPPQMVQLAADTGCDACGIRRSEERRVGKECRRVCRSRWSPYH
jgi:hypothetical protein